MPPSLQPVSADLPDADMGRSLGKDLQATYSNYKQTLQQLAQKIGDIEQEAEEHKLVPFQPHTARETGKLGAAGGLARTQSLTDSNLL